MKRFFAYMARAPMLPAGSRQFGHTFCWYSLILWLPLHDDRIAAPFRVPMGKTVQTTTSSAFDRDSCHGFFFRAQGEGSNVSSWLSTSWSHFLLGEGNDVASRQTTSLSNFLLVHFDFESAFALGQNCRNRPCMDGEDGTDNSQFFF